MPERSAKKLLEVLPKSLRAALGADLVGIYLYGSYVSGGFEVGVSDLDLVAVTRREVEGLDLPALNLMHAELARRFPAWVDRLDIAYIDRGTLESFRTSPGRLAVMSPGEPFNVRPDRASEWLQNWYLLRETAITVYGPAPETIVPPIDRREFVAAVVRYAIDVADRLTGEETPGSLAYAVLVLCRARFTHDTGEQASKEDGAAWTRRLMPGWEWLIDAALRCRLSRGVVGFDDTRTHGAAVEFVRLVATGLGHQAIGRRVSSDPRAANASRRSSRPS